jgi:hypothetical protein
MGRYLLGRNFPHPLRGVTLVTYGQWSGQLSSTLLQLLLEVEQRLLAHADKALTRPVEIDDDRQY